MRVGIVCYPTFGGSGVLATELGKALANKGYEVHFISYNQPARLDFFSENVFYHEVNIAKYPLFEYAPYETALAGKMVSRNADNVPDQTTALCSRVKASRLCMKFSC